MKGLEGVTERSRTEDLRRTQERKLARAVRYAQRNSPLYRVRLRTPDVGRVRTLEDLEGLPFTTRSDLRRAYPFGLLAVPLARVVRLHVSPVGQGLPMAAAYTQTDLERYADLVARAFRWAGARRGDIVQNALGEDLLTAGLGFQVGGEHLGLAVLPMGANHIPRQIQVLRDFGATILCSSPSQALALGEAALRMGFQPTRDFRLRLAMAWGEALPWEIRGRIEETFGMRVLENYGPVEVGGPGVAVECNRGAGLHLASDHFLAEVVDPVDGSTLGPGERGELVLTHLAREAVPLVRYRTGDLTALVDGGCECGNPFPLIEAIRGKCEETPPRGAALDAHTGGQEGRTPWSRSVRRTRP